MNDWKYGVGVGASIEEKLSVKLGERGSLMGGLVGFHYDITPKATIPGGARIQTRTSPARADCSRTTQSRETRTRRSNSRAPTH